jgi:glycosyltransferase involved in cell wall biosynthesis
VLRNSRFVNFLNLRGDQGESASIVRKTIRVVAYYWRLIRYAATARPRVFHILWNNKFEWFDRTILTAFYKLRGRKVVLTAHNINMGERDGVDSGWNRWTLRAQYRMADHIFVHTRQMRAALQEQFAVPASRVTVIPFGLNSTVPDTALDRSGARERLGLGKDEKVLLFFGNIAPYKGLEYLVRALGQVRDGGLDCRLLVVGRLKASSDYWTAIEEEIQRLGIESAVTRRLEFVPDDETEVYFKAADVFVLPYKHIFQSGVLFLGYNFGLPVVAADVGSLREDVVEGATGFLCDPEDSPSLAHAIRRYFESDLYRDLAARTPRIREYALEHHSWTRVGETTRAVYSQLMEQG